MRIEDSSGVGRVQGVRSRHLYGIDGVASTGKDSVELSERAAEIRAALEALAGVPEVREEQVTELLRLKCEFGQGMLFSRPLSAAGVGELLRMNRR